MDQWVAAFRGVGQWEDGDCEEREETGGRVNLISRRTLQFDFRLCERKTKEAFFMVSSASQMFVFQSLGYNLI
jgi:hypothetical protein